MKVVIQKVIYNDHGQCIGVGGTYEVDPHDAEQLVSSGDYKYENVPIKAREVKPKAKRQRKADVVEIADVEVEAGEEDDAVS